MKSLIDTFSNENLNCSWATIQVGWELGLLSVDEVHKFVLDFSENHPDLINKYISEIIFSTDRNEIENILKKIFSSLDMEFPSPHSSLRNREWKKWRYYVLRNIRPLLKLKYSIQSYRFQQ